LRSVRRDTDTTAARSDLVAEVLAVSTDGDEPTGADLAEIEREWPLISAELEALDVEISILATRRPCALDHRRKRRAESRVIRAWVETTQDQARVTHRTGARSGGAAA
jgi:hypothetical protein